MSYTNSCCATACLAAFLHSQHAFSVSSIWGVWMSQRHPMSGLWMPLVWRPQASVTWWEDSNTRHMWQWVKPRSFYNCRVTVLISEPMNRPYRKAIMVKNEVWVSIKNLSRAAVIFLLIHLSETPKSPRRDFFTLCIINFLMGCEKCFPPCSEQIIIRAGKEAACPLTHEASKKF